MGVLIPTFIDIETIILYPCMYKQSEKERNNIMAEVDKLLCDCLYFTANRLSRVIGKMAEEEFLITGLSPNYALLVNIVNDHDGISQKEIGQSLHMKPSTITRFIDKLESKKLVERRSEGKNSFIFSTKEGKELQKDIDKAWQSLHDRYSKIIGCEEGEELTLKLNMVGNALENI